MNPIKHTFRIPPDTTSPLWREVLSFSVMSNYWHPVWMTVRYADIYK